MPRLTEPLAMIVVAILALIGVVLTVFGGEILECLRKPPPACGSDTLLWSIGSPGQLGEGAILHYEALTGPNNVTSLNITGASVVITGSNYSATKANINATYGKVVRSISEIEIGATGRADFIGRYLLVTINSIDDDEVLKRKNPQWIKIDAVVCKLGT